MPRTHMSCWAFFSGAMGKTSARTDRAVAASDRPQADSRQAQKRTLAQRFFCWPTKHDETLVNSPAIRLRLDAAEIRCGRGGVLRPQRGNSVDIGIPSTGRLVADDEPRRAGCIRSDHTISITQPHPVGKAQRMAYRTFVLCAFSSFSPSCALSATSSAFS